MRSRPRVVGHQHDVVRRRRLAGHVVLAEPPPDAVVVEQAEQRVDQRRVEPPAAPLAQASRAGLDAPVVVEDLDGLRRQAMRDSRGISLALQAVRLALSRSSARRASAGPAAAAGNSSMRAIWAPRSQRASKMASGSRAISAAASSRRPRAPKRCGPGATDSAKRSALVAVVPVDELQMRASRLVVGPEERADARRVAGATRILEQQRVVQLPSASRLVQAALASRAACRSGRNGPHAHRLAFGEVERVRKRGDDLGEAELGEHAGVIALAPGGSMSTRAGEPGALRGLAAHRPDGDDVGGEEERRDDAARLQQPAAPAAAALRRPIPPRISAIRRRRAPASAVM